MNNRQKSLIQLILKNEFVSCFNLARELHVSERTVLSEIKHINEILSELQIVIDNKFGKGYYIKSFDKKKFEEFRLEFLYSYYYSHSSMELSEREMYTLRQLLRLSDGLKSNDLLEKLQISESTLHGDIKNIRRFLKKYDLKLSFKPYRGMYISGKEMTIRQCIVDCCEVYNPHNTNENIIFQHAFTDFGIELAKWKWHFLKLQEYLLTHQIVLSQLSLNRITTHFDVMLLRIETHHHVHISEKQIKRILKMPIYTIVHNFFSSYNIKFLNLEEVCFFTVIVCINLDSYTDEDLQLFGDFNQEALDLKQYANTELFKQMNLDFEGINVHRQMDGIFIQYYFRSMFGIHENTIYKNNSQNIATAPASSYLTYQILKILQNKTGKRIDYYLWSIFTTHFYNSVMKIPSRPQKLNIILINSYGRINNDTLKYKLKRVYGNYINRIDCLYAYELEKVFLEEYDYILSDYPKEILEIEIADVLPIPVIHLDNKTKTVYNLQDSMLLPGVLRSIILQNEQNMVNYCLEDIHPHTLKKYLEEIFDNNHFTSITQQQFIEESLEQIYMKQSYISTDTIILFHFHIFEEDKCFRVYHLPKGIIVKKNEIHRIILFSTNLQEQIFSIKNLDSIFRRIQQGIIDLETL